MFTYERFERLCKENGYTPSGAVIAIGRSKNLAAKWKTTNATPSADVLHELANLFDVSVDYLLGKEETADAARQLVFENYGQRVLFDTSKGCPSSQLMEWASMIERWKEEHLNGD